jgi:CHAT domain-containing protein
MVEFRADFLQDKQAVYEDAVRLCVQMGRVDLGLAYAERAKSRALQDLISYRLDLSVHARTPGDDALVAELTTLRGERDRLARRSNGTQALSHGDWLASSGLAADRQRELGALEKRITDLWHKLLVRNADYARDASLWEVRAEPVQAFLAADMALVEYFDVRGRLMAFVVTPDAHHARLLEVDLVRVQQLVQMLQLNLKAVPRSRPEMAPALIANANGILAHLGRHLVAPIADLIAPVARLIVVPHGVLHYLPFHALRDEHGYLVERTEVSYLPGASLLRFVAESKTAGTGMLAVGHSCGGLLPHAVDEALGIAQTCTGQALIEREATASRLASLAVNFRTLHLAAHGDFRPDNPLFSGLFLEDGWLTTLDIFSMRLSASLVTLSACQTGRNVISGGDELLGLMRAFLYAGAASLVLSLWPVEDRSTAKLMQSFYTALASGASKGAALRHAQLAFVHKHHGEELAEIYAHPYFWAPFFLVGDSGPL